MKKITHSLCILLFLLCSITIFWFLQRFTIVNDSMQFLNWTSSYEIMPDGSEIPFTISEGFSNSSDASGMPQAQVPLSEGCQGELKLT